MSATPMPAPERGNLRGHHETPGPSEHEQTRSVFKAALEHIDRVKTNLREVVVALNQATTLLRTAEKEQKITAREIQTVRAKLREIQSVEL